MKIGLVLGKFMPLHTGHLALIDFAAARCQKLYVLLCYNDKIEPITGAIRWEWLQNEMKTRENVVACYTDVDLPNSSVADRDISKTWAQYLKNRFTDVNCFFSSELYGEYVADYWGISYENFDIKRQNIPISATDIREDALKNWDYLAKSVQPFFVKKIAIVGTESTGKTTMCQKLAAYFNTVWVAEAGREIVAHSDETHFEDILEIAEQHAKNIKNALQNANKLLFIDTELLITTSYSRFFFDKTPLFTKNIINTNRMDLYFYLEKDAPFVQDGTRLSNQNRDLLDAHHKAIFKENNIDLILINGSYEERFMKILKIIQSYSFYLTFISLLSHF